MWRTEFLGVVFAIGCTAPPSDQNQKSTASATPMEGSFEYVGALKGQSILTGGRFVFLFGPADGSAPMIAEAGRYHIARDTATHTILYSTDSARVGLVFRWTPTSWSGDTLVSRFGNHVNAALLF
jgi:hypothetical protein